MLSIRQILFTAVVIALVWLAFRLFDRAKKVRAGGQAPRRRRQRAASHAAVEDLMACPACGDFAAAGAAPCHRPDCPRR